MAEIILEEFVALTLGGMFGEARRLLSDDDKTRYTDADLADAFNDALLQIRAKRPDAFIRVGLRNPVPHFTASDLGVDFPLDQTFYSPVLFYIVGRSEIREDTFGNDARATALTNKFTLQLLKAAS